MLKGTTSKMEERLVLTFLFIALLSNVFWRISVFSGTAQKARQLLQQVFQISQKCGTTCHLRVPPKNPQPPPSSTWPSEAEATNLGFNSLSKVGPSAWQLDGTTPGVKGPSCPRSSASVDGRLKMGGAGKKFKKDVFVSASIFVRCQNALTCTERSILHQPQKTAIIRRSWLCHFFRITT